jgi:hypothetical protein
VILEQANEGNRNILGNHLARLKREAESGGWVVCLDPVVFTKAFALINGQHRLCMLTQLGKSENFVVVWDAPEEARNGLDRNRPWSLAAKMSVAPESISAASVIHTLVSAEQKLTDSSLRHVYEEYLDDIEAVRAVASKRKILRRAACVGAFALAASDPKHQTKVMKLLSDIADVKSESAMAEHITKLLENETWNGTNARADGALKLLRGIECHATGTVSRILRPTTSGLRFFCPSAKYRTRHMSPELGSRRST